MDDHDTKDTNNTNKPNSTNDTNDSSAAAPAEPSKPDTKPSVGSVMKSRLPFLDKTGIYPLELTVAMVVMIILASVMSFGAYALGQYISGNVNIGIGESALWSAASVLVWLPVCYAFYMRSRAHMEQHPEVADRLTQRTFTIMYQIVMMITVIGFAFTALYSLLNAFVQVNDVAEAMARVSLPSAVSALVFGGAFIAFFRRPLVSRKVFANGMAVLAVLIVLPVIVMSMVMLRGANADEVRSSDLAELSSRVKKVAYSDYELPESLADVDTNGLEMPVDGYKYNVVDDGTFELCANFQTDTSKNDPGPSKKRSKKRKQTGDVDFYKHPRGNHCFKVKVSAFDDFMSQLRGIGE
ncbi:hypothetical protein CR983_04145 [Candidatus Saccharibacteria bacterium]|nr:MAG: hypothetical protein CR983_04145 [Candidatus Saccharibacteria bacterium]